MYSSHKILTLRLVRPQNVTLWLFLRSRHAAGVFLPRFAELPLSAVMSDYQTQPLSDSVLDSSSIGVAPGIATAPRPQQVGPYRILELLGEGGFYARYYSIQLEQPVASIPG